MKKIILLIATILFFATFTTNAQIISYSQTKITKVKKEKKPRAGYFQQSAEMLFGGFSTVFETGANYIAGYRFNDRVFLGGGVGFSHTDIDGKEYDHYDCFSLLQARLFLNAKFYLTKTRAQPFLIYLLAVAHIGTGMIHGTIMNGGNLDYQPTLNLE